MKLTKSENPHLYCVIDNCNEEHIVSCSRCDGEFCKKHYDEGHKNGVCIYQ